MYDYTRHLLHATLDVHKSWVRDLRFVSASSSYQLVSVGDRIAWWHLLPSAADLPPTPPVTPVVKVLASSAAAASSSSSSNKSNRTRGGLVQTFEFQGRFASKLFVSEADGRVLLTVTDSGILYVLRQLVVDGGGGDRSKIT